MTRTRAAATHTERVCTKHASPPSGARTGAATVTATNRDAYVRLRKDGRKRAKEAVENEVRVIDRRVADLQSHISGALVGVTPLAGWFRHLPLTSKVVEQIAGEEFDRLASMPGVAYLGVDAEQKSFWVTVRKPRPDGSRARRHSATDLIRVRIGLEAPTVHVDGSEWTSDRRSSSLGPRWLRVREKMIAAELIGAGDLVGLIAEVVPELGTAAIECAAASAVPERAAVQAPDVRQAYVAHRARSLVAQSEGDGDALVRSEKSIAQAANTLNQLARRACLLSRVAEQLAAAAPCDAELAKEYDELLMHPGIELIEVTSGRLRVRTAPVVVKSRTGQRHLIGTFNVDVVPGRQVTMHNTGAPPAGVQGGCDHPHVRGGRCCLGNIFSLVNRLLMTDDVRGLIHLSIEYLYSLNESSTLAPVTRWPVVDRNGELVVPEQ